MIDDLSIDWVVGTSRHRMICVIIDSSIAALVPCGNAAITAPMIQHWIHASMVTCFNQ
jgi:hypothetical protein